MIQNVRYDVNKKQTLENIENLENVNHCHSLVFLENIFKVSYMLLYFCKLLYNTQI